jgi:nitroreductase
MKQLLNVLNKRFTTKHWDHSKTVSNDQLEYITDCIYMAPSKMAAHLHKCVVITDSAEGKKIKDWLFYEKTWTSEGRLLEDGNQDTVRMYNGQYHAPVLIAWLNPINAASTDTRVYCGISTNVNLPSFQQRQNDIFISTMAAIMAGEEQGLNTGFGSCHDHKSVAERLGFPDHECPIVVGFGYAKDMTELEKEHGVLIPIFDPDNQEQIIGYDATNFVIGHTGNQNRNEKPKKSKIMVTI